MVERGELDFQPKWLATEPFDQIADACQRYGLERLKPIKIPSRRKSRMTKFALL